MTRDRDKGLLDESRRVRCLNEELTGAGMLLHGETYWAIVGTLSRSHFGRSDSQCQDDSRCNRQEKTRGIHD